MAKLTRLLRSTHFWQGVFDGFAAPLMFFASLRRRKCPECKGTGWASYEDWIGPRGYRVYDHCRACRRRAALQDAE